MKKNKKVKLRLKKGLIKKIFVGVVRVLTYFVVGVLYIIYLVFHNFNKMVAKLFMAMPLIAREVIIYFLVGFAFIGLMYSQTTQEVNAEEVIEEKEEVLEIKIEVPEPKEELVEYVEEKVEQKNKICENEIACMIFEKALSEGLTNEEAYIIVAISRHETGNWTSKAFNNRHNLGGIMGSNGLKNYDSLEDGIEAMVNLLKNRYFNRGLNTIEQIGNVYCPIGASNDPTGVNQYWIPNVTKYYNEYANQ